VPLSFFFPSVMSFQLCYTNVALSSKATQSRGLVQWQDFKNKVSGALIL